MTRAGAIACVVVLAVLEALAPTHASAQEGPTLESGDLLADLRLDGVATDHGAGLVLMSWGAASVVVGGAIAVGGGLQGSTFWLTTGLTHAVWGLVNGLLSLTLLELSGADRAEIERERTATGEPLLAIRDDAIEDGYQTAITFAVNVGLDVFYVASGLLLYALAREQDDPDVRDGLAAFGLASAIQGGVLIPFDLAGWMRGISRAHARRDAR